MSRNFNFTHKHHRKVQLSGSTPITANYTWTRPMVYKTQDILYQITLTPKPKLEIINDWGPILANFFESGKPISFKNLSDVIHPEDRPQFESRLAGVGLKHPLILRWRRQDGVYEWYEHVDTPILDEQKKIIGIQGIARYYTDHHEAELALARAEKRFKQVFQLCPVCITISDIQTGQYLDINDRIVDLLGYTREEIIGKTTLELNNWIDEKFRERITAAVLHGESIHMQEVKLRRKNGEIITGLISAELIDLDGKPGLLAITQDITEWQRAMQAYDASQERMREIIEFLPDATFVIDRSGKIIAWNRAIVELTGVAAEKMIGKSDYEYALPFYQKRRPLMADIVLNPELEEQYPHPDAIRKNDEIQTEIHLPEFNGKDTYLWIKTSPLYDNQHQLTGSIESIRDITEIKRSQVELQEHLHEMEVLNRVIAAANSSLNPNEVLNAICVEIANAMNVPQTGIALLNEQETGLIVMGAHDQNGVPSALGVEIPLENNEASQTAIRYGKPVAIYHAQTDPMNESAHSILKKRKTASLLIVPIILHGKTIGTLGLDTDQPHEFTPKEFKLTLNCAHAIGQSLENASLYHRMQQELTERQRISEALRESEERYRTLVENQGEGVAILDMDLRFTFTNPAAENIFGAPPGGLIGKQLTEFVKPDQKSLLEDQFATSAIEGKLIFELDIQPIGTSERNLILTANFRRGAENTVDGIFAVFRDNTERKQAEIKLRFLSTHDTLTELYNRTYFEEEMVRLAVGRQYPISIIVVDVDGLKHVNDNYGHPRGDELLRRTAGVLRASFRQEDLVARIGGDEFGILLPNSDTAAAARGLERIRKFLASHNASNPGLQISLSVGAATAEAHESLTETYKRADQAMYLEKLSRRGRTVVDNFR